MFSLPDSELQVDFVARLQALRDSYLQEALMRTVSQLNVSSIDKELAELVPSANLSVLASRGMRGELFFPVPIVLLQSPKPLGYYRLLYGYSQKEFYTQRTGYGAFKKCEEHGTIPARLTEKLSDACKEMIEAAEILLLGIEPSTLTPSLLDHLTLLTLGPQLRGGANVRRGTAAIRAVFGLIRDIVAPSIEDETEVQITLKNAARRSVDIRLASDPDVRITERMQTSVREIIAIEVKGGADFSNIHNRIGEAEKSHQKARSRGITECWTVLNVDQTDLSLAKTESPSTNRFYLLSDLIKKEGLEFEDFAQRIASLTGVANSPSTKKRKLKAQASPR